MRRIIFGIVLLALALLLTGCGGQKNGEDAQGASNIAPFSAALAEAEPSPEKREIDVDLSLMSDTMVYSQVYLMSETPEDYLGKVIRCRGDLSYYKDTMTGKEYFAAVFADATACCAQALEFVRAGEYAFPEDYPELGTEIVVTGVLDMYEENGFTYLQLLDAEMTWEA